ncbi:MAG: NAD(P)/FAD-dependent oxidoreductase [Candidatus Aminicenantes bacterium]|nr:NAD(P)/FAD-dependent oxidoreductase [Candidatus Aminicenantes bacterium]
MPKKIVIIGAGIGGLTAGNLLAGKGHRVTLFEAHTSPGGYTAGFRRKGYYFESGTLSFESSDTVFKVMRKLGLKDRIPFVRQPIAIKSDRMDAVCRSFSDLKSLSYDAYPEDKAALDRYFFVVDKMVVSMMGMMKPKSALDILRFPCRLLNFMRLYKKYKRVNITEFTARYFDPDSDLYRIFKDMGYPDMSAAILPGAYLSFLEDYWTVKSGMQSWADILAKNFEILGGELRLNSRVEKIVTAGGRAKGVVSGGKEFSADAVISASDYKKTFCELLDDRSVVPQEWLEKIEKNKVSEGIFTVYLGLNLSTEELKKSMRAPHVSFRDEQPGADIHDSEDGEYFEKSSIMLYSPSLHDPELAPKGKSSLMIQAVVPFRWLNNWGGGDRKEYNRLKEKVKKTLIAKAEKVIPGLTDHIDFEDAATPLTYERYTGNTDGATSAWSWNPANRFYKNILSINIKTPVENLLIGSCWSAQIGGVPSAILAAVKCAKRIG